MAFKFTTLPGQETDQQQPTQPTESWGEFATNFPGRVATQAIPRIISGAVGIPAGVAALGGKVIEPVLGLAEKGLAKVIPGGKQLQEQFYKNWEKEQERFPVPFPSVEKLYKGQTELLKKIGVPERFLEQKPGFIEGTIGRALTGAPIAALLPGGLFANLLRETGAAAGGQAVEEFGGGPLLQAAGSIAGGIGTGKGLNAISNLLKKGQPIPNLTSLAGEAEKRFYDTEKELGKNITVEAPKYKSDIIELGNEIADNTGLSTTTQNELLKKIEAYKNDVASGSINASKLAQRNKEINAAYNTIRDPAGRTYLERIQKAIFQEGENIGKQHPKWHNAWESARSIGRANSYQIILPEIIEEAPKLLTSIPSKLGRYVLGLTGIKGGLNTTAQAAGFFIESPATRKLLADAALYTVERNIPALERTYRQINKEAEKFEKQFQGSGKGFYFTKL